MQIIGKDCGDCIHNYEDEGKKLCSILDDIECDSSEPEADLCEDFKLRYKIYARRGGEVSNNVLDAMREFEKDIANIPPGMEAQKTLEGSPMQLFFQSNEPKKTPRPLKKNDTQRKEKKGSNNLATFGMQDPGQQSIMEGD